MDSLKPGQTLRGETSGCSCHIDAFIGASGQGEVYRVMVEADAYALKRELPPGASVALEPKLRIRFGRMEAEVKM